MRKNLALLVGVLFVLFIGLQVAEPVSAAKLVDKVSIKRTDVSGHYGKFSLFTYQKGVNYIKIYEFDYWAVTDHTDKVIRTITKVGKNKVKITTTFPDIKETNVDYEYTKLTAAQYYWRVERPALLVY